MSRQPPQSTREERLAAQLRANLRRRKDQARALHAAAAEPGESFPLCQHEIDARAESDRAAALPKPPPAG